MTTKPIIRRIETSSGGHRYLDQNDRICPGVTTILNCLPKDSLVQWQIRKAVALALKGPDEWRKGKNPIPEGVDPVTWLVAAGDRESDIAAKKGTNAHNFAEGYMLGMDPDQSLLTKAESKHVDCFLHFVRDFDPKPVLVEKTVVYIDPKTGIPLFAGTIDLIARLTDGFVWMIDYKASAGQARPSHALQMSAYVHSTHWLDPVSGELYPMPDIDRGAVVLLNGGGEGTCYRAVEVDISDVVFSVFKSLLRVYNFSKVENRVILGEM